MVSKPDERRKILHQRKKKLSWVKNNGKIVKIAEQICSSSYPITIATHEQGKGKSTAICCILLPKDIFLLPTHKQVAEKRQTLQRLGLDFIHFFSLRKMVTYEEEWDELNPDFLKKELTDEVLQARRDTGRQKIKEINQAIERLPENETEPVKNKFGETEILELYTQQVKDIVDTEKIILGTKHFFPTVEDEDKLSSSQDAMSLGDIFLDEGIEMETDRLRLNLNDEVRVFSKGFDALTPEKFEENLYRLDEKFDKFDYEFTEIWEMYLDFLEEFQEVYNRTRYYKTGKREKGNYRVKVISTEDFPGITPQKNSLRMDHSFVKYWLRRIRKRKKYNYIKSEFQIEIAEQMENNNEEMVDALVNVKKIFDFFYRWFLRTNAEDIHNEIWIEQYVTPEGKRKSPIAEVGSLTVNRAFNFQFKEDRDLVIAHAEASEKWLRTAWEQERILDNDFDDQITFIGQNSCVFDATSYLVAPAQDKKTFTKGMADSSRWKKIYQDINAIHNDTSKTVGVIGYKDQIEEDYFDCPVLYWNNKTGHNALKDVDVLFIFGSPRPPAKEYLRQRFYLTGELPKEPYEEIVETEGRAQTGLNDEIASLIFTNMIDRDVRDAGGRMRDQKPQNRIFRIGLDSDFVEFDRKINMEQLRGEMGVIYGLDEWQEVTAFGKESNMYLSNSSHDGISYRGVIRGLPEGLKMERAKELARKKIPNFSSSRFERAMKQERDPYKPSHPPDYDEDRIPVRWYNNMKNAY